MNIADKQPDPIHPPSPDIIMVKTLAGALALAALPSALAFRNTSPFFLFSTAEYACQLPVHPHVSQLTTMQLAGPKQ